MMFDKCFDVSHNNGPIKWSLVAQAGYKLAFIKATQGTKFVDPALDKNWEGADDANILVVPYHFINSEPASLQAAHFIEVSEIGRGDPYMLDWERLNNVMPSVKLVEELGDALKIQTGRDPLVYHGLFDLSSPKINAWPWFVPKWGPQPKNKWLFWQDTANRTIPGIRGGVDHDNFNGTEDEMNEWHSTGKLPSGLK